MKLMRTAALAGLAKKAYDEARKPENQEKIRHAVEAIKARRARGAKHAAS
jgi:hypothetical protein